MNRLIATRHASRRAGSYLATLSVTCAAAPTCSTSAAAWSGSSPPPGHCGRSSCTTTTTATCRSAAGAISKRGSTFASRS